MGGPVVYTFRGLVLWRFDVGFDISFNKLLNKQTTAQPHPQPLPTYRRKGASKN